MNNADAFLRPPEKLDRAYADVTSETLWAYDGVFQNCDWPPLRFTTDQECSALSGVPERSLLTLQTAGVIHATKAPIGGGTHRRVWHMSEVAAAAAVECLKMATNINYQTTADVAYQASVVIKLAFLHYVNFQNIGALDEYRAEIILSHNQNFYIELSDMLRLTEAGFRNSGVAGNIIPIAAIDNGTSKAIAHDNYKQKEKFVKALESSRFRTTVNLKNVFQQFEQQAKKLRT